MVRIRPVRRSTPLRAGWSACVALMVGLAMTPRAGAQQPPVLESGGIGKVRVGMADESIAYTEACS
jgi:hypothetical protein